MQSHRNDSNNTGQQPAAPKPVYTQHSQHAHIREPKPRYTIFRGEVVSLDRLTDLREAD